MQSNLSAAYLAAGLLAPALEAADAAIKASPTWAKGYYRRGAVLAALELWPEAVRSLQKALLIEPRAEGMRTLLATCEAKLPPLALRGGASCYSWGRGEFGALGHADTRDRPTPKVVETLRGIRLADIACGTGHALVVSEEGCVYGWGWNSKSQVGVSTSESRASEAVCTPTLLGSLLGLSVRAVACGAAHSLAVTLQGEVYSWGLGGSGQLGHADYTSSVRPRCISRLATDVIIGVACGFGHSIALTKDGALRSWGWNRDGQLGVGDSENRNVPQRLSLPCTAQQVACGGGHSCVVSTTGDLYAFGSSSCGQLGLGEECTRQNVLKPALCTDLKARGVVVAYASCGEEFTLLISQEQRVFTFGLGNVSQRQDPTTSAPAAPCELTTGCPVGLSLVGHAWRAVPTVARSCTRARALPCSRAVMTGVGAPACCMFSCCGDLLLVYSWRLSVRCQVGQLGNGREGNAELAYHVDEMSDKRAEVASCGAAQAHVVTTDGRVWVWGRANTDAQQMIEELRRANTESALHALASGPGESQRDLNDTLPTEVATLRGKKIVRLVAGRRHFVLLTCAACPRHSLLEVPSSWTEEPPAQLLAGKRVKMLLRVHDAAGVAAASGGERVVARLLWDGGDEHLVGSAENGEACQVAEDAAAAVTAAASKSTAAANTGHVSAVSMAPPTAPLPEVVEAAEKAAREAISASLLVDVDDCMDGTYEIVMRPRREGLHALHVLLNGEHVLGSPQPVRVLASRPNASQCQLVAVRTHAPVGATVTTENVMVHLLLRDEFGNELAVPPGALDLDLTATTQSEPQGSAQEATGAADAAAVRELLGTQRESRSSASPPEITHTFRDDGVVVIQMRSLVSGRFNLTVTLDGQQVKGSPLTVEHTAGPAFAPRCHVHANGVANAVAGQVASLVVRCYDAHGNHACDDANLLVGTLIRTDATSLALPPRLPPVRARPPEPPGTSVLMFTPTKAATYQLEARMNGQPLPGSPFSVAVTAGDAAAVASSLTGEGLAGAVVRRGGLSRTLDLATSDVWGNRCQKGGADVQISLRLRDMASQSRPQSAKASPADAMEAGAASAEAPLAGRLLGTVSDRGDGTYALGFKALAGEWLLEVTLNGRPVGPTPCSIVNVVDPSEEEERRAREEAERERQLLEAKLAEEAHRAAEEAEKVAVMEETRRRLEADLKAAAMREDEKERRAAATAERRAAQEEQKRRQVMAALRREEETRRRAQAALEEVQREKERQLVEALQRKKSFSKRCGGGLYACAARTHLALPPDTLRISWRGTDVLVACACWHCSRVLCSTASSTSSPLRRMTSLWRTWKTLTLQADLRAQAQAA